MSHEEDIDARLARLAGATASVRPRADFSPRVMQRIGMTYSHADGFDHPLVPRDSPLRRHVTYVIWEPEWDRSVLAANDAP